MACHLAWTHVECAVSPAIVQTQSEGPRGLRQIVQGLLGIAGFDLTVFRDERLRKAIEQSIVYWFYKTTLKKAVHIPQRRCAA